MRLDQEIVRRKLVETRELGKRLILAGKVKVNGHIVDKASEKIKPDDKIELKESPKYVSRGGFKLEHALKSSKLTLRNDLPGYWGLDRRIYGLFITTKCPKGACI